jgi:hypothetical protein
MPATTATTDRDCLMQAVAELNRHGILACSALVGTAPDLHARVRAALARRFPDGMGSYAFWTHADEHRFDPTGTLTGPLALHCSDDDVALAAAAACRDAGIAVEVDDRTPVLRLEPRPAARAA